MKNESKILSGEEYLKTINEFMENKELQEEYALSYTLENAKILDLLDKELPNIFKKNPSSRFNLYYKNYDMKYAESILCEYMDKIEMKASAIDSILDFIDGIKSPICDAQSKMLHCAFNKLKSPKKYFHFIAIKACIEVCGHIVPEEG